MFDCCNAAVFAVEKELLLVPVPLERPEEEEGEEPEDSGEEKEVVIGATGAIEPGGFAERKAVNFVKSWEHNACQLR